MRDNELIIAFSAILEEASANAGWGYVVLQTDNPTQQGVPSSPSILFQKLFDNRYGWPWSKSVYEADPVTGTDKFVEHSIQTYETTFQVSALVIQDPTNTDLPTASDVVNYMANFLGSRTITKKMLAAGFSNYRVGQIRNPYFEDDRHRFEANPSFDVVLTHDRDITFDVGAVHTIEGEIYSGIEGQGTFPIPNFPAS